MKVPVGRCHKNVEMMGRDNPFKKLCRKEKGSRERKEQRELEEVRMERLGGRASY